MKNTTIKKPVIGTHLVTGEVLEFSSLTEARANGFQNLGHYIKMNYKQCKGYSWKYKEQ